MEKMSNIVTWLIVLLLIVSLSDTGMAAQSLSNSGGGSWQDYREITIKENSGNALTDYQILIQLSGSSFPTTTSDGADIRFTDTNENELSYWIENWDYAGRSASIWVKVPSISAGTSTTIRMYYGNPNASPVSNGDSTFNFFDDFIGTSLNMDKWYVALVPPYSISSSILTVTTGAIGLQNALPFDLNNGYILEGRIRYGTVNTGYSGALEASSSRFTALNNSNQDATIIYIRENSSSIVKTWVGNGAAQDYIDKADVFSSVDDTWYILGIEVTPSTIRLQRDYAPQYYNNSVSWMRGLNYISLGNYSGGIDTIQETSYDWVRVRKYAYSEPTINIGPEIAFTLTPTLTPIATPISTPTSTPVPISTPTSTPVLISTSAPAPLSTPIPTIGVAPTSPPIQTTTPASTPTPTQTLMPALTPSSTLSAISSPTVTSTPVPTAPSISPTPLPTNIPASIPLEVIVALIGALATVIAAYFGYRAASARKK